MRARQQQYAGIVTVRDMSQQTAFRRGENDAGALRQRAERIGLYLLPRHQEGAQPIALPGAEVVRADYRQQGKLLRRR